MFRSPVLRPALAGALLLSCAVALPGCAWFRGKEAPYLEARESRPLEVPPDLVLPSSSAALQVPPAPAGGGAPGAAPPALRGPGSAFTLDDSQESAFRRVGLSLARIEGVASSQPVAALNAHEVSFRGQTFLVRVSAQGEQARIDAISTEGAPLSSGPAAELLGLLRGRLQ